MLQYVFALCNNTAITCCGVTLLWIYSGALKRLKTLKSLSTQLACSVILGHVLLLTKKSEAGISEIKNNYFPQHCHVWTWKWSSFFICSFLGVRKKKKLAVKWSHFEFIHSLLDKIVCKSIIVTKCLSPYRAALIILCYIRFHPSVKAEESTSSALSALTLLWPISCEGVTYFCFLSSVFMFCQQITYSECLLLFEKKSLSIY